MSTPAGLAPTQRRRDHDRRRVFTETLVRDTHKVLQASGIIRSASWVERTARAYASSPSGDTASGRGIPYGVYLAAQLELNAQRRAEVVASNPDLAYLLGYSDPTGEMAVRNLTRGKR